MSQVPLLLIVAVLQPLMVDAYVHLNTDQPISLFLKTVNNCKQFLIVDSPVALYAREGFCVVFNCIELLASVDDLVLRQDTSNYFIAGISFHDYCKSSIELGEDGTREEFC